MAAPDTGNSIIIELAGAHPVSCGKRLLILTEENSWNIKICIAKDDTENNVHLNWKREIKSSFLWKTLLFFEIWFLKEKLSSINYFPIRNIKSKVAYPIKS